MKLVKFSAPWCAPCKTLGVTLAKVLPDFPDVVLEEVDITEQPERATKAGVRNVPLMDLNGSKLGGAVTESTLRQWIANVVNAAKV